MKIENQILFARGPHRPGLVSLFSQSPRQAGEHPFMKKTRILIAAALLCAFTLTAQTPPTDNQSFFKSVSLYFTELNTNLDSTFGAMNGCASAGVASIQKGGVTLANDITLSIAPSKLKGFGFSASVRDSGVAGTIVSAQGGVEYHYITHDVDLTPYLHGGKWLMDTYKKPFAEIGLRVSKALTTHTYSMIGLGVQLPTGGKVILGEAGFTF